jgi:hypothetical protein
VRFFFALTLFGRRTLTVFVAASRQTSEFVHKMFTQNIGTAHVGPRWRLRLSVAFGLLKESASTSTDGLSYN